MIQIFFVFTAAIVLELLGAYMAVVGLSSKSSVLLITLAIALDFSKIVIAAVLYKNWNQLSIGFKLYLVPTLLFLMLVTSYGAYAYLIQEFNKTTATQVQLELKISLMEAEKLNLETRKKEIDDQIASVPNSFVTQKRRLSEMFQEELNFTNNRIQEINRDLPQLKQDILKDRNTAGTLGSLAQAWGTEPEQTIRILALMMVVVIDPLAITMLMVGNFLIIQRKEKLELKEEQAIKDKKEREEKLFELQKMKILTKINKNQSENNSITEDMPKSFDVDKQLVPNVVATNHTQLDKVSNDEFKQNTNVVFETVEKSSLNDSINDSSDKVETSPTIQKKDVKNVEIKKPRESKGQLSFANKPLIVTENLPLNKNKRSVMETITSKESINLENNSNNLSADTVDDDDLDDILNIIQAKEKKS